MINSKLALHYSKLVRVGLNGSNIQWLRCRIYDSIVKTPPQLQSANGPQSSHERHKNCTENRQNAHLRGPCNKWPGSTRLAEDFGHFRRLLKAHFGD